MDEARDLYVVLSRAVEGREVDFDRWYDEVHIPELLELDEVVAARRYELIDGDAGGASSMAIYECLGDGDATAQAIAEALKVMVSDEDMKAKARAVGEAMAKDGVARAAESLEALRARGPA